MRVDASDGIVLAAADHAGAGPPILFVHATGFCKEVWDPVIAHAPGRRCVLVDQRGHGESAVPDPPIDWWDLADDVLAVVDGGGLEGGVGVGHSSGAAALAMAELIRPGTFERLVLFEPIVFPGPVRRQDDNPMSAVALKRRRSFPSEDHAFEAYLGRGPFAHWDERVLRAYVAHGFRSEGGQWVLRCAPETEAEFYRGATATGAFDRLSEIECPVTLVVGEQSDTHQSPFRELLVAQFPHATLEVVPRATHFVPMEFPELVAALAT